MVAGQLLEYFCKLRIGGACRAGLPRVFDCRVPLAWTTPIILLSDGLAFLVDVSGW